MAFAVEDFRDLLQLLRDHPEWREQLRRELLGEELLKLPELVAGTTRAIDELRASVAELRSALISLDERLAAFVSATDRRFGGVERDLSWIKGVSLEMWFDRRPGLVVKGLRRARVVNPDDLDERIQRAGLTEREEQFLRVTDMIVAGREGRGEEAAEVHIAVEISNVVDRNDVDRALERSALLGRLGLRSRAAVAGQAIVPSAQALATENGVEVTLRDLEYR